ncbi:23S rRNA (cytidine1920-2'-O)/16S rRNA (cytidine1409-2'-O)-methyltransferase [Salinibacterium amurskyense]|uniref:23S rRNA (Cytidine1920-2'-O)/16S rRNA (Cytidine1409-2'-O)-methyltransferase n=1 Tax=Salinibacterium amurskyense TaxID=205941 RepID=A0A2M9DA66_9MICO|nr:TlyA family RNA methyltransferase [Salinibacterium amurskyense]PJJ82626.1 23S rRNA (cytidine1920-2'-O)/16S rRNA (cytidine1409-2'-O)-methyltransferase [Salinibacterium amurskyense]RLQ82350.1 TlyA family RNA methyltransferase [Salinibacterium amurskyense]GHD76300.1 TlyA family rRNA (cytidine-2'-O)-methyltransferase [Salinibacterium amurskyense]
MASMRLDAALAARGLARSRTHAAKLIADNLVTVSGVAAPKASTPVTDEHEIDVAETDHYVSRAAHKLVAGLDAFGIDPTNRLALDVGASTGGFTQVLLERGAREVIALDVGHGQLVDLIRSDARVRVVERANARYLTAESLAELSGTSETPTLVVSDLSFISLRTVLPAFYAAVGESADYVLLVKPQFEVGRTNIREGIVHGSALRDEAIMGVLWAAWDVGLGTAGVISSPIAGNAGNREYLVWLSARSGSNPTEWLTQVSAIA